MVYITVPKTANIHIMRNMIMEIFSGMVFGKKDRFFDRKRFVSKKNRL